MSKTDKLKRSADKLYSKVSLSVDTPPSKEVLVEIMDRALEVVKETMDLLDQVDSSKN